jgi:hypothetical protein
LILESCTTAKSAEQLKRNEGQVFSPNRARIPSHAFSEADRLLARPEKAAASPSLRAADSCWRNWQNPAVTNRNGRVRANHPIIARAFGQVQSATSLRLMLCDPLAFVWRYALGWRPKSRRDARGSRQSRAGGTARPRRARAAATSSGSDHIAAFMRSGKSRFPGIDRHTTVGLFVDWPYTYLHNVLNLFAKISICGGWGGIRTRVTAR